MCVCARLEVQFTGKTVGIVVKSSKTLQEAISSVLQKHQLKHQDVTVTMVSSGCVCVCDREMMMMMVVVVVVVVVVVMMMMMYFIPTFLALPIPHQFRLTFQASF